MGIRRDHEDRRLGKSLPPTRTLSPVPKDLRARVTAIPTCEELGIVPNPAILPGEQAAKMRLRRFLRDAAAGALPG